MVVVVVVVLGDDGGRVISCGDVFALKRGERVGVGQRRGVCTRHLLEGVHKGGAWPVVAAVGSDGDVRGSRGGTSVVVARAVHGPRTGCPAGDGCGRRRRLYGYTDARRAGGGCCARGRGRATTTTTIALIPGVEAKTDVARGRTRQVEAGAARVVGTTTTCCAVAQVYGLVLPAPVEIERVLGGRVQLFEDGLDHLAAARLCDFVVRVVVVRVVMARQVGEAGHLGGDFMDHGLSNGTGLACSEKEGGHAEGHDCGIAGLYSMEYTIYNVQYSAYNVYTLRCYRSGDGGDDDDGGVSDDDVRRESGERNRRRQGGRQTDN